jgi:nucleoside-diphosphate-sugar epimerase
MTKVLITGASGFIGQMLTKTLLNDKQGRYHVVLTDIIEPTVPKDVKWPQNATCVKADLVEASSTVVDESLDVVFMFHGVMSSGAEADFELGK